MKRIATNVAVSLLLNLGAVMRVDIVKSDWLVYLVGMTALTIVWLGALELYARHGRWFDDISVPPIDAVSQR